MIDGMNCTISLPHHDCVSVTCNKGTWSTTTPTCTIAPVRTWEIVNLKVKTDSIPWLSIGNHRRRYERPLLTGGLVSTTSQTQQFRFLKSDGQHGEPLQVGDTVGLYSVSQSRWVSQSRRRRSFLQDSTEIGLGDSTDSWPTSLSMHFILQEEQHSTNNNSLIKHGNTVYLKSVSNNKYVGRSQIPGSATCAVDDLVGSKFCQAADETCPTVEGSRMPSDCAAGVEKNSNSACAIPPPDTSLAWSTAATACTASQGSYTVRTASSLEITIATAGDASPSLTVGSGSFSGSWSTLAENSVQFGDSNTYRFTNVPSDLVGVKYFQGPRHSGDGTTVTIYTTGTVYLLASKGESADQRNGVTVSVGTDPSTHKCWMRLPSGCDQLLNETSTPETWFIDPNPSDDATCNSRVSPFNTWCNRADAEYRWATLPDVAELSSTRADIAMDRADNSATGSALLGEEAPPLTFSQFYDLKDLGEGTATAGGAGSGGGSGGGVASAGFEQWTVSTLAGSDCANTAHVQITGSSGRVSFNLGAVKHFKGISLWKDSSAGAKGFQQMSIETADAAGGPWTEKKTFTSLQVPTSNQENFDLDTSVSAQYVAVHIKSNYGDAASTSLTWQLPKFKIADIITAKCCSGIWQASGCSRRRNVPSQNSAFRATSQVKSALNEIVIYGYTPPAEKHRSWYEAHEQDISFEDHVTEIDWAAELTELQF